MVNYYRIKRVGRPLLNLEDDTMKNAKKFWAMLLALTMMLSMAACGSKNEPAADSAPADDSQTEAPAEADDSDSDVAYVKEKGTLVVGMTDFAPMDYKEDGSDEWIGFDADMAKAFAESLGVNVEFVEINWDNKAMELQTKAIDAVWNGMTLTEEAKSLMDCSDPYCLNGQVVVISADKADAYTTTDSLKDLSFAVENGSAGAEELDALGIPYTAMDTQAKALMEVASGASDACVIDLLMAGAMVGEGTSYPDLTYTVQLNSEEYGVGFRQGSDLPQAFNEFWKQVYDDGTVMEVATTYGVQESIINK